MPNGKGRSVYIVGVGWGVSHGHPSSPLPLCLCVLRGRSSSEHKTWTLDVHYLCVFTAYACTLSRWTQVYPGPEASPHPKELRCLLPFEQKGILEEAISTAHQDPREEGAQRNWLTAHFPFLKLGRKKEKKRRK